MPAKVRFHRSSRSVHGGDFERRAFEELRGPRVVSLVPLGPWSDTDSPRERLSRGVERWEGHARKTLSALTDKLDMKIGPKAAKETAARLITHDGERELEVFRASGAFRWTRHVAGDDKDDVPAVAPNDPVEKARAFLVSRGLWDGRAEAVEVHTTDVTRMTMDGKFTTHAIETHVEYNFRIQGLPVFGAGGKMRVTFGKDGEVAGFLKFFREPSAPREVDSAPPEWLAERLSAMPGPRALHASDHLRRRLRHDRSFSHVCRDKTVSVLDASLGYYAAPPRLSQDALVPVFAFDLRTRMPRRPRYEAMRYLAACPLRAADVERIGHSVFAHVRR